MTKSKSVTIQGKQYVEVNERLKHFRSTYIGYSLISEVVNINDTSITIKATIYDDKQNPIASGIAQEVKGTTFINKTSYIENCETSAWGRALANLGIGIDESVASADEVATAIKNQGPELNHSQVSSDKNWMEHKDFNECVRAMNEQSDIQERARLYNEA